MDKISPTESPRRIPSDLVCSSGAAYTRFCKGLSRNQQHAALPRLAVQRAPSIFLSLPPTPELQAYTATSGFLHRCWRF
ncbi:hypothetical protein U0070_005371 [Myodes glareolus]|uniref:Uncharacterized protein n=1 Tax=Myodes glareolus TaxID=447135 RepID=A0AAW0HXI7_MYOGA